ncbi:hypothetical protein U0070_026572 [Myodes glareolus]|uniref:Uncharacterized protein n=1 Tax=Myodes glareolus TaxID=447135 RepID=A0AAW0IA20_MYOGA
MGKATSMDSHGEFREVLITSVGERATSQSDDSAASSSEEIEERDTKKTKRKKKEKSVHVPVVSPEVQERTSKRRNWKVATDARTPYLSGEWMRDGIEAIRAVSVELANSQQVHRAAMWTDR